MLELVWLVPLFPLAAFAAIVFYTHRWARLSGYLAIGGIAVSGLLGTGIFLEAVSLPELASHPVRAAFDWIPTGGTSLSIGFQADPLTSVMVVMVTFVCLLIFVYSQGYMRFPSHLNRDDPRYREAARRDIDPRYARFFAYVSLFAAGMLGLVTADNLLILFVSWEIMGLCSYLLIGFWDEKTYPDPDRITPRQAGVKAFLTTRVGDVLLLLGILLLYVETGSLGFGEIFSQLSEMGQETLVAAGLLIFAGAVGKSAQFPLHVWLPDAMEGPTPVSALIHAATMVAAGVYLVARTLPVFLAVAGSPALVWVAGIGALTALFAATMGLAQDDIKRVLAYSTISQLGYMMMALGIGSLVAGVFHLLTHAFFKALLFLGAGSVIHGVEGGGSDDSFDPNDMTLMGGLRERMPLTFWTFLIGALALSGVFPLAGFWSKDEILSQAFSQATEGGLGIGSLPFLVFVAGALAAFLTALYMGRQLGLVFWGRPRHEAASGAHESPRVMTWPLLVLAGATLVLGLINLPLGEGGFLGGFLEELHGAFGPHHAEAGFDPVVAGLSTLLAVGGLILGWRLYRDLEGGAPDPLARLGPLWTLWRRKYYIDEIYGATVVRGTRALAKALLAFDGRVVDGLVDATGRVTVAFSTLNRLFDTYVVDGAVNGVGWVTDLLGREMRLIQTGQVQNYLLVLFLSVIMLAGLFLYT